MRHGQARKMDGHDDFESALRDKGKRNAQRMGVWLEINQLVPDYIVCSPAEHVKTTAEKTSKVIGLNVKDIRFEKSLYNATASDVIEVIKACPQEVKRMLLVGHNSALESTVLKLSRTTVPKTKKGKVLLPGTLVCFHLPCSWSDVSTHCAELSKVVYSIKLPRLFPFPNVNGNEKRVRPAYYYSQSSVIPYRMKNARPEVLIVSSSGGKHWVVPKGIHEPGMSAHTSAAKEAYEEAGIEGHVAENEIGRYEYKKWQAICTVSVFPMKVTRVLNGEQWEECYRQRRWVTLEETVKLIHNIKLADIIATLPDYLGRVAT